MLLCPDADARAYCPERSYPRKVARVKVAGVMDPWPCKARPKRAQGTLEDVANRLTGPGVVGTRESHQGTFQTAASGPPLTVSVDPNFSSVAAGVATTAAILATSEVANG
jgi:hypothetical protein